MIRLYATPKVRQIKLFFCFLSLGGLLLACADGGEKSDQKDRKENKKEDKKASNLFEVEGKVFSIPSPIQTAFLLKNAGSDYQSDLMNSTEKLSNYNTTQSKALILGVYGADLGYSTIYDQSQEALSYMAVSKKLTEQLGISGIYNDDLLKRFEDNIGKEDSLMALISDAFKTANRFLKNNEQEDLSALILAGGWIETLHFATQLGQKNDNIAIKNRIGEQKITINNLINLLMPHQNSPEIGKLINNLNELKDIYSAITFSYEFKEPETIPEENLTIIKSVSSVEMTNQQLDDISDKVASMRNSIIK